MRRKSLPEVLSQSSGNEILQEWHPSCNICFRTGVAACICKIYVSRNLTGKSTLCSISRAVLCYKNIELNKLPYVTTDSMLRETLANLLVSVLDNYKLTLPADEELKCLTIDQEYWISRVSLNRDQWRYASLVSHVFIQMYVAYRHI